MSLPQMRTFIEVYRRRSLSDAARALSITQPAVSQHIASLEAQLGHPLFDRHARGVRPTVIADDFAASIGGSLDRAEAALAMARARSVRISGTVHIAAPSDLLGEMITPRLGPLLDSGLDLRLHIGGRDALYAMLLDDKVHLGITASQPEDARLAYQEIGREDLRAVAAPAIAERIARMPLREALNTVPYLAYDLDRPLVRNWLEANQIEVTRLPALTAPDLRVLRSGLCAGLGWTVLPGYLTSAERTACTLVEIAAPVCVPTNALYLVWAKSSLRHPRVALARDALIGALQA
ncbi:MULTISPECIES: LysR family transcriptional regulator [unclassified Sphingomonas]|uniref:LysR family transcriptional regulator n=1 Tax=unclassified Sphingomonas TaxID=196159 RepID=UPI002867AA06|nr:MULTISPECIES: LysR family transcriptional regulator [unclassified Sphingomonas]MDR6114733.1 DNA-binding transcriptional LysR family regulator [Sphingomonas sp. SORGH_AS_0789]MDR6151594.1 DNA-binding transcriptional LysR family regulator [Sphingomonas sp. SORGH_AS_0742]